MVSLADLRKDDILTLQTGEKVTVLNAIHHSPTGPVVIQLSEDYALVFQHDGNCPDVPQLSVTEVEFVKKPEDDEIYYVPQAEILVMPVVTIKGRNKIIVQRVVNSVFDLNQFPILPNGSKIEADTKPTAIFTLTKMHGRKMEVIKKEQVICDNMDHAKAELKKMKERFENVEHGADISDKPEGV